MVIDMQLFVYKNESGHYRLRKWIIVFLAVLLLIAAGVAFLITRLEPIISKKLKEGVYNGSFRLYRLDFNDIDLNLLTGSLSLYEVALNPDTAVYNQLKTTKLAPANLFQVKMHKLKLNRISLLTAYFKNEIELNAVILDRPSINMLHFKVEKRLDDEKDKPTLYEMISKHIQSLNVKIIKVVDADFAYINGENSRTLQSIKHLDINVNDFLVDSASTADSTRYYYAKDIGFQLTGYRSLSKDKMYTMKVDTIRGSAMEQTLKVKGLQMIPMYPDLTFSRKYKYGKDRYDLLFSEISFSGIDFARLAAEGNIYARKLKIGPAKVNIFVNRELPPPPGFDKVRNFPQNALKRLPIQTIIDTVKLTNIDVAYTEYNPISQKRGTVYFENLKGSIINVTNDTIQLAKKSHAIANLTALIMKTSRINVRIDFNLTDKNAAFNYRGNVAAMDMRVLNPMAKNMGLVEIETGQMQKTEFNIQANARGSSGRVNFYYRELKVKLLKESEVGAAPKKQGLLSFLANNLLIIDANPSKGKPARSADITFQRTPAASFFNLMWKSLFIGIREIVGLGVVPVKTPEEAMEKIKDKKQERKEKRQEKRAQRLKEQAAQKEN